MKSRRFDDLSRAFAVSRTRRAAVQSGGVGLAAAALGIFGARAQGGAQEATPVAGADPTEYLFVQTFATGTLEPSGTGDVFTLTLTGGTGQTVYFSDRPERYVGTVPTESFLNGEIFDPADPPNAAIVAQTPDGEDILVVVLTSPGLDAATGTVTYEVQVLADYQGDGLASLALRQADDQLPTSLGSVSLFIDDATCLPDNAFVGWVVGNPLPPEEQQAYCEQVCCSGNCGLFGIAPAVAWFCFAAS